MSDRLREHIYQSMNFKSTEELTEIWQTNDRAVWSDMTFEVIYEILTQRLKEVPMQNEPVYEHLMQEKRPSFFQRIHFIPGVHPDEESYASEYAPEFYRPREVMKLHHWLNWLAIAAAVMNIFRDFSNISTTHNIVWSYFFHHTLEWEAAAWMIAFLIVVVITTISSALVYLTLKALASILKILMEMEYNSRPAE